MKNFKWFQTIKKLYQSHTIAKLAGTILLIALVGVLIWYIPISMVKKSSLGQLEEAAGQTIERELSKEEGEVLAAESDSKQLYINTKNMNLRIVDKATKKEWNALLKNAAGAKELSLLTVVALGEDNNLYEYNSYEYCTLLNNYQIFQTQKGVEIKLRVGEGESTSFYEYYPSKMPVERFEEFFLGGIKNLIADGTIEESRGSKYEQTLKLIYRKNTTENCYAVANNATPPASATKQLLELAKLLNYTTELLLEDSQTFGLSVNFKEPASFELVVEAFLDGDDFLIQIPTDKMVSNNDFYVIQNIQVLPNFGAVTKAEAEEGYILVPDGSGALFEFNTYNATVPDYSRPFYNNDYYTDYYFMPEYGEELTMPIYGMTYGKDEKATHGFLAIIEQGAETSYINAKLADAASNSGSSSNKVYASFDVTQYHKVKVYGPYSTDSATYLSKTDKMKVNYTVRYQLFPENVTYYKMAEAYRNYLMKIWGIKSKIYAEEQGLYLDFIGSLSLTKRILGIPYDARYSMTTYQELSDILEREQDKKLVIEYSGFFNGGLANKLANRADLVDENGSKKELKALQKQAEAQNIPIFYEASLSTVYDDGNGFFANTHAIHDYSNKPATIYRYFPPLGYMDGTAYDYTKYYYLLSPYYLSGVVDKFLKEAKEYNTLSIPDLGSYVYSDYKYNRIATAYQAAAAVDENLSKIADQKQVTLANPNMNYIKYSTYATDISRESSNYTTFQTTIPFRQLVLNGLTIAATKNVNMSAKSPEYYILQAVELAMYPKFTLTAKSVDVLKNGAYSYLYSTEYGSLKDTIDKVYQAVTQAYSQIGTMEIKNHYQLTENVFCTEYATGVSVITNYNLEEVTIDGQMIEALSYQINTGNER